MNHRSNADQEILSDSHYVEVELGINVSSNVEPVLNEELNHCGEEILCISEEPYQECDFENSEVVGGFMQGTDQTDSNVVDVVIPVCTNTGEVTSKNDTFGCVNHPSTFSSNETDFEIVYSSLPPDINIESLIRATKSSVCGESLRVTKENGKFKIRTCDITNDGSSLYDCERTFECVVCKRLIEAGEMFLNFPEDLDRRRIWGNMLGFKYNDMLRLKYNVVVLSAGHICTDHFSEECFRAFNFNKAAIEAFGIPLVVSPAVKTTPSKKRTPWDCTICSYRSHSVVDMQQHMLHHTDNGDDTMRVIQRGKGYTCPFCRKCTYGYKTISGFRRHLMSSPLEHCQLKRIWEIARDNCRSSELDPGETWSSWTERSVYFAYHGCDLPVSTSRKRRIADIVPVKSSQSANSLSISRSNFNTDISVCNNTFEPRMTYSKAFSNTNSQVASPVKHTNHRFRPNHPINKRSTPYLSQVSMPIDQAKMPVLIRMPALPHNISQQVCNATGKQRLINDCKSRVSSTSLQTNTIAEALSLVSDYPEEQRLVVEDAVVKQPLFNSIPMVYKNRITLQHKKTQRQLEATEARLRLFGDCSYVELPDGYTTIETQKGPRIVEKTWGEELTPAVKITNRRFKAVKRFDI